MFSKSAHWPRRRFCLKDFIIFRSDGCFVQQSETILAILEKGYRRTIFSEIILKSAHWPRRRCCLKAFSIFSSDGQFVQQSGTILAILVEGHPRNISMKLFLNWPISLGGDVV